MEVFFLLNQHRILILLHFIYPGVFEICCILRVSYPCLLGCLPGAAPPTCSPCFAFLTVYSSIPLQISPLQANTRQKRRSKPINVLSLVHDGRTLSFWLILRLLLSTLRPKPASKSTGVVWEVTAPVPKGERCSHAMPIVLHLFLRQFQMGRETRVPEHLP